MAQVAGKPQGEADAARVDDAVVEETCDDLAKKFLPLPLSLLQNYFSITSHRRSKGCCECVLTAWSAERGSIGGATISLQEAISR